MASPSTPTGSSAPTPGGCAGRWISRASLVGAPQLLLLDEPTAGLDPRSRYELWDTIRDLVAGGTSVLLTTQYLEEADQLAARIAIVDHGRVITEGTPDDLKAGLGLDVVEVHVTHAADLQRAVATIASLGPEAPRVDVPTRAVAVAVDCGSARLLDTVRELDRLGVEITDANFRRATLDEVFLALTGQSAADETGNAVEVSATPTEARRRRRRAA